MVDRDKVSALRGEDRDTMVEFAKSRFGEAQVDEFMKAGGGPGSRGGHIVGRTKSGKPIYASNKKAKQGRAQGKSYSGGDDVRAARGAGGIGGLNSALLEHMEAQASHKKSKLSRKYKDRSKKKPASTKAKKGKPSKAPKFTKNGAPRKAKMVETSSRRSKA